MGPPQASFHPLHSPRRCWAFWQTFCASTVTLPSRTGAALDPDLRAAGRRNARTGRGQKPGLRKGPDGRREQHNGALRRARLVVSRKPDGRAGALLPRCHLRTPSDRTGAGAAGRPTSRQGLNSPPRASGRAKPNAEPQAGLGSCSSVRLRYRATSQSLATFLGWPWGGPGVAVTDRVTHLCKADGPSMPQVTCEWLSAGFGSYPWRASS